MAFKEYFSVLSRDISVSAQDIPYAQKGKLQCSETIVPSDKIHTQRPKKKHFKKPKKKEGKLI